jgi:hypothetical protein
LYGYFFFEIFVDFYRFSSIFVDFRRFSSFFVVFRLFFVDFLSIFVDFIDFSVIFVDFYYKNPPKKSDMWACGPDFRATCTRPPHCKWQWQWQRGSRVSEMGGSGCVAVWRR